MEERWRQDEDGRREQEGGEAATRENGRKPRWREGAETPGQLHGVAKARPGGARGEEGEGDTEPRGLVVRIFRSTKIHF